MSIQRVSSDIPSPYFSSRWKYDVFLSFRGEDTRKKFTDHLYAALTQKGIYVFRDDRELERGKPISPRLLQAIEESRFSIVVLSRNYASSIWCLDEIAKIVECKNTKGQNVLPIFYDVTQSVVRNQTGVFREAFAEHEEKFEDNEKIQKWRNALREVANLFGWHVDNRHESEFIQDIVQEISTKLGRTTLMNFEGLVGIYSRLEELRSLIDIESNDVRMIGIWGMGGIGKTTIARVLYELVSDQFEGSCFLANVREISEKNGLVTLQRQLLSEILKGQENNIYNEYDGVNKIKIRLHYKKVLVVIDDADHIEQLNKLAGKHEWFGLGSRIIITTRDKHLLSINNVDKLYEAKELNYDEALQLFILKAFKNHQPPKDYRKLSELVVRYAGGLPLALKVLGSFLFDRAIDEWNDAIERLKRDTNKEILDKLEISFDALEETEKKIFLDIACFFKGMEKEYVTRILDGCGFNPTIGISVLLDKSLITIFDINKLGMHDLIQEMGRRIVKRESGGEPGKCSRLWDEEDIRHVLTKNTGTKHVEAIILEKELHLSVGAKVFSKMTNLRLLKIRKVQLPKGLEYLSNELRLLDWDGYSLKSLPSNLQLDKLVEFQMECSRIEQLWKGIKPMNSLKSIRFKDCKYLTETPDLTGIPNLEELTLDGCSRLSKIHPPSLVHKKIKKIYLSDCSSLTTLPSKIHMESLESLLLFRCPKLKKFPEIMGIMECLRWLTLEEAAIKELPLSIELLAGLENLTLRRCKNLLSLPGTIKGLRSLGTLHISFCSKLTSIPSTIYGLESLHTLKLYECNKLVNLPSSINSSKSLKTVDLTKCSKLVSLPSSINSLKSLQHLFLSNCSELVSLPSSISSWKSLLTLNLSDCSKLVSLPSTINDLESLTTLYLSGCSKLENVPESLAQVQSLRTLYLCRTAIRQPTSSIFTMKNLEGLYFRGCRGLSFKSFLERSSYHLASTLPSLSGNLCSLTSLDLSYCNLGEGAIPSDFLGSLISLKRLDLSGNSFVSLPTAINRLSNLGDLRLKYCTSLQILPELPPNIHCLLLDGCVSLETLPNALRLIRFFEDFESKISCQNCLKLVNGSRVVFSMLKEHLKVGHHPLLSSRVEPCVRQLWPMEMNKSYRFSAVVPGSEFPEWFKHKNESGSFMKIKKPNNSKLVGCILCCLFIVHAGMNKYGEATITMSVAKYSECISSCTMSVGKYRCVSSTSFARLDINYEASFSNECPLEHLWLWYLSSPGLTELEDPVMFSIKSEWEEERIKVKRCGFHPVYEHEDYNELIQDFVGSITEVESRVENLHFGEVKRKIEQIWSSKGSQFQCNFYD